jgi:hypothetical protein
MGNLIGNILNFLTSPIGFVIIFGLIGGIGKLASWLQQERSRRAAIQSRSRQETEELRMGRPVEMAAQPAPVHASAKPQSAADRQRALQEQRAAQLRALQQQRLAELRAKRAQAAGGGAVAAPAPVPARSPAPPPVRSAQRPQAPPKQNRESAPALPGARSPRPRPPQSRPVPTMSPMPAEEPAPEGTLSSRLAAGQTSPVPAPVVRPGLGALFGTTADLRRAVILSEILGPPVSDRDPEQSGSF